LAKAGPWQALRLDSNPYAPARKFAIAHRTNLNLAELFREMRMMRVFYLWSDETRGLHALT
jgi:hypothetical protein